MAEEEEIDYWRNEFIRTEGFTPTMWQLMCYAAAMKEQGKQFWKGVIGW